MVPQQILNVIIVALIILFVMFAWPGTDLKLQLINVKHASLIALNALIMLIIALNVQI